MIPSKPNPEDAADPGKMDANAPASDRAGEARNELGEGRQSRGGNADNQRHPPHVTENSQDAPVQDQQPRPRDIEPLPANASGSGLIELNEEARTIDPTSAYAHRPEEDKNRPPSKRVDDPPESPAG